MTENPINMEKVNKLYDDIDIILDKHIKENSVNYMEIDTAIMLIEKKMDYEETSSWFQFMIESMNEEGNIVQGQDKPKGDMYV